MDPIPASFVTLDRPGLKAKPQNLSSISINSKMINARASEGWGPSVEAETEICRAFGACIVPNVASSYQPLG